MDLRFNFRPGKRSGGDSAEAELCGVEELGEAAAQVELLLEQLEGFSAYLKSCAALPPPKPL